MKVQLEEPSLIDDSDIYSEDARLLEEEEDELKPWEEAWMLGYEDAG